SLLSSSRLGKAALIENPTRRARCKQGEILARGKRGDGQGEVVVPLLNSQIPGKFWAVEVDMSMTSIANAGNAHALVREDENRARGMAEGLQGTSPTPRSAAYHSDVELAGRSQAFVEMMKQVDLVSGTDSPVLLTGEPGAGQELVAAAIHQHSDRSDRPFVMINCAEMPGELIEAKLLEADGGTVFLDEVTQTSESLQLNLIRLVQTGELRVIAASSCDLEQDV